MTTEMMMEAIEERFAELAQADGYEAWWDCEGQWERYEEQMITEGLDAEMVHDLFAEMAEEL